MYGDYNNAEVFDISQWRSILTLVVFISSNVIVACPFRVPIYLPPWVYFHLYDILIDIRILPPWRNETPKDKRPLPWVRLYLPLNLTTAPLLGVVLLLLTTAIGRRQIIEGTVGANNISPLDIIAFAFTIGYISCSIDATGVLRYLCVRVLAKYGARGRWLFCYLYLAVFMVGLLFGNDPVIQMGMLFITYMAKLSSDMKHPKAWLFTQFAVANIASTILVSWSTTNVIICQAFKIGYAEYSANVVVPVVTTVLVLPPFLLFCVFAVDGRIPTSIQLVKLPREPNPSTPTNPDNAVLRTTQVESETNEETRLLLLAEVSNPFLDKRSAAVGFAIMAMTLIVLLVLTVKNMNDIPVFWISLPASGLMLFWDVTWGRVHRKETRSIAQQGRDRMLRHRSKDDVEAQPSMDTVEYPLKTDSTNGNDLNTSKQDINGVLGLDYQGQSQASPGTDSSSEGDRTQTAAKAQSRPRILDQERLAVIVEDHLANVEQTAARTVAARASSPPPYVSQESSAFWSEGADESGSGDTVDGRPKVEELAESKEMPALAPELPMVILSSPDSKGSREVLFPGRSDYTSNTTQSRSVKVGPPPTTLASLLESLLCAGTNIGTTVLLSRMLQRGTIFVVQAATLPSANKPTGPQSMLWR
ncbi:arsenite efflux transporter [Colletotrichum plurivorum]|uniref:Arsenite efflux transporter n=1 Tax=Colletotrichum plurivorum TaxID=2175906 RepID=A0A8H6KT55_9PEZI|nr:arsenite efflux transporter [Colletotrichum plurivorum]